ncbi:MAG: hypothetical protein ABMA14_11305 [Hyphomonadaceae bacterium]
MPKLISTIGYHKDGSIWNKGQTLDGEMHGHWEFYRKDGVIMRSGSFDRGVQVGEWTTYDKAGKVYKVTKMKAPATAGPARAAAKKAPAKKAATKAPKPAPKSKAKPEPTADALMSALDHPLAADYVALRKAILFADTSVTDGVKWNSLSFRTTEWFATVNLRSRDSVQLVLHLGPKAGKEAAADAIPDPKGLLKWLGKDRALATLGTGPALKANLPALKTLVKAWIRYV